MPVTAGRAYVRAPAFIPHRFGLLSAADVADDGAQRWRNGVDTEALPCDEAQALILNCPVVTGTTKTATSTGFPIQGAEPFTVYAEIPCSPVGLGEPGIQANTVEALRRGEGRAAERVFWTGTALGGTIRPHLAEDTASSETSPGGVLTVLQTAATVVTGTVVGAEVGLAYLEGALAECYGGEGIIHVPATVGSYLYSKGGAVRDGDRLRTGLGNKIAIYASNDREGPTGVDPAAGSFWMYATGNVNVHRSEIEEASGPRAALDRSNNTFVYIAERTYVIHWDCCHLAQQITLS
jgi:hypothetical protein